MSGKVAEEFQTDGEPQELIRECVLFGLLFRAVMVDLEVLRRIPLKFSYWVLLEEISHWAERQHQQRRRMLGRQGCKLLLHRKEGSVYVVQYQLRGYLREAIYSIEVLRAECQEYVRIWMIRQAKERTR